MSVDQARVYASLFDPFRLKVAREAMGLRKTELAKRVGITPAALTQYESAVSKPSAPTLMKLAMALGQSVEFFASDGQRSHAVEYGGAFFRSLRSTRQIQRDKAQARAFLMSEVVHALRRRVKMPALNVPDNLHVTEADERTTIEKYAGQLRAFWQIAPGPVPNMVRLLEANGFIVVRCAPDGREVDAFSRWYGDVPLIVLNYDKPLDRTRFDAAHELGHIILHADPEAGNGILETQAHMFAAAFLMPESDIKYQLPTRLFWAVFRELKRVWGVSVSALLRRARDLGRLTDSTYRRAMMKLAKMRQRTNESAFPLDGVEPAILLRMAVELLEAKGYTVDDLARDTKLQPAFIRETVFDDDDTRPVVSLPPSTGANSAAEVL
jgi:Zn-dependent peptidase ImmA (M78 family)/transcriptional regulator with XRE-family HTH domain